MALTIPRSFSGTPASIKSQAESLLAKATTKSEVDQIMQRVRSSNARVDNAVVVAANARIDKAAADKAAAEKAAAAKKAAAEKAAADKAAAEKAAAAAKQAEQNKAAAARSKLTQDLTARLKQATTQQELDAVVNEAKQNIITLPKADVTQVTEDIKRSDFYNKLSQARTTAQIDAVVKEGNENKVGYDVGRVNQAYNQISVNPSAEELASRAAAEAAKTPEQRAAEAKQAQYQARINTALSTNRTEQGAYQSLALSAKSQDELDYYAKVAQDRGQAIDAGFLNRARTIVQQTQARAQAEENRVKGLEYQTQLTKAKTADEANRIIESARSAGTPINQGWIDSTMKGIAQREAQAAAAQKKLQDRFTSIQETSGDMFKSVKMTDELDLNNLSPLVKESSAYADNSLTNGDRLLRSSSIGQRIIRIRGFGKSRKVLSQSKFARKYQTPDD